jgi:hypothetical protein
MWVEDTHPHKKRVDDMLMTQEACYRRHDKEEPNFQKDSSEEGGM